MPSNTAAPERELLYDFYDEVSGLLQVLYTFSVLNIVPVESPLVQGTQETIEDITLDMLAALLGVDNIMILPAGHTFFVEGQGNQTLDADYHLANYSSRVYFPTIYAELGITRKMVRSFFLEYKPLGAIEDLVSKTANPYDIEVFDEIRAPEILLPSEGLGRREKLSEVEFRAFRTLINFTPVAYICEYGYWWLLMDTPGLGQELENSVYPHMVFQERGALTGESSGALYDALNGYPLGRRVKYNLGQSGLRQGIDYRYDNVSGTNGDYLDVLFPIYFHGDISQGGTSSGERLPPYRPGPRTTIGGLGLQAGLNLMLNNGLRIDGGL